MKNEKEFLEKVEEGAIARKDISTLYAPRLGKLNKMFQLYFGRNVFKFLNACRFFEKTDGKHEKVLRNFGEMYSFASMLGRTDHYDRFLLEKYGMVITEASPGSVIAKITEDIGFKNKKEAIKFEKLWENEFNEKTPPQFQTVLGYLMDAGQTAQSDITAACEDILEVKAAEAEEECEVTKGPFMKAVALKAKLIARGPVNAQEYFQKIHDNRDSEDAAIDPVMKEITD